MGAEACCCEELPGVAVGAVGFGFALAPGGAGFGVGGRGALACARVPWGGVSVARRVGVTGRVVGALGLGPLGRRFGRARGLVVALGALLALFAVVLGVGAGDALAGEL